MKKLNNYICWGLLLNGIWILSVRFNLLPDFIEGIAVGIGLLLIFMGMLSINYDLSKLQNYKKEFIKKIRTR